MTTLFTDDETPAIRGGGTPAPIFIEKGEMLGLGQAMNQSHLGEKTIRRLCKKHGIARQTGPGAPLQISALALEMVVYGDFVALEALRAGRREDPRVVRFLRHLGLPHDKSIGGAG